MSNKIFDKRIELSRVLLRRLKIEDVDDMYEYTSNPEATTHLHWEPHKEKGLAKSYIETVIRNYESSDIEYTYGIELKSEKKLIGVVRVINISFYNKRAEYTAILNPKYQGNGYMTEVFDGFLKFCFNEAGLNRIQGLISVDNLPSQKLVIRSGWNYEGTLKDYWFIKGEYKDAKLFAITAAEFTYKR